MEISMIGVNHRTAPIRVRERFSLPKPVALELLTDVRDEGLCEEALVLDTCNRTEVYVVSNDAGWSAEHLMKHIAHLKGGKAPPDAASRYHYRGLKAVEHLFRVAAGLDSQVLGEHEVLGQIKDAYRTAVEARTARFVMNRLLHMAFHVGKRARTETRLSQGTASVPQAAVEFARERLGGLSARTTLLIGAGDTAELAAQALLRAGARNFIVANRTLIRAKDLARRIASGKPLAVKEKTPTCPALRRNAKRCTLVDRPPLREAATVKARAIGLSQIASVLPCADLVVTATGAPGRVLKTAHFRHIARSEARRILIMDIAVPRDVDPAVGKLPHVTLRNVDDLDRVVAENVRRRREELPRVEAIIAEEVRQFGAWLDSLEVAGAIRSLRLRVASLQKAEIARYGRNFSTSERKKLDRFATGLCDKILNSPITFLREAASRQRGASDLAAVETLRRAFGIGGEETTWVP